MKTFFIVADVHSFYDEMIAALNEQGYDREDPDHIFVCLGDLLDRGEKPLECLDFVNSLPPKRKLLIRGNHEDLIEDCIYRRSFLYRDLHNGTEKTVVALSGLSYEQFYEGDYRPRVQAIQEHPALQRYLSDLVDYAELEDYILVHGWVPRASESRGRDWRRGDWYRARWANGMEEWKNGVRPRGKTVICGHWHASWGHAVIDKSCPEFGPGADFSPFSRKGILAIDACTAYSHKVNCVKLAFPEENRR